MPTSIRVLSGLLLLQSLSAMAGGAALVLRPDGAWMSMPPALLRNSPFRDFFYPGLFLTIVLGLTPLLALYGLFRRASWGLMVSSWAGAALMLWIVLQQHWIGSLHWLQPVAALCGAATVFAAALPSSRARYY